MDSVANLIVKMKNASLVGHPAVIVPYTKLNFSILDKLQQKGYVKSVAMRGKNANKTIEVELIYENGKPKFEQVQRVSKLSRRVYEKSANIRAVRRGYGSAIISTPNGILTDAEARKANVGGEILFRIW